MMCVVMSPWKLVFNFESRTRSETGGMVILEIVE
jgi:hypothetical protein